MSNGKESLSPSEMDPKDLPDVPAFQDEYTRAYMQSTEQVKDGYYPLISKTNGFTLHFPEDMVIDDTSNAQPDNHYESLIFHYENNDIAVMDEYIIHYLSPVSDIEWSKDYMNRRAGEELNFKKLEAVYENQYIEIAEIKPNDSTLTLAALIWNDNEQQTQIFTDIICRKDIDKDKCTSLQDEEQEKVIEVFKSIKLINN
ncbi:hypothetical protein SAMN05421663_105286 [Terribacillus halophilus]|uniref:Uncharacterized protein n=1 Tax=Terribacillus halophilus TaxID=361279 RepID=A0A1G6R0A4_9BACI|nr:hypothetical protein [Terribacillus halophilus]SDC97664.1 hypothetical protein SAMN05421663_105286 [Terribacillus halophilus]